MEEKYKVITTDDFLNDEALQKCMDTIKEKNEILYKSLYGRLRKGDFPGMRDDVLYGITEYADHINDDKNIEASFYIADIVHDIRISPDGYEWFIDSVNHSSLGVSNLAALFTLALDKGISISEIKEIFSCDDEISIMGSIESHKSEDVSEKAVPAESDAGNKPLAESKTNEYGGGNSIVSVFGDLLTVMTCGKNDNENTIYPIQNKYNEILSGLQNGLNDAGILFGEIIHEWEADKEEILRLKAIYNMQQRMLAGLQQRLHESEEEIFRLQAVVRDAEKMEIHYESINKKVQEIQELAAVANVDNLD